MKIIYLHQYFATPDSNAGTRSYEMAKRLVAKGHEVTFVTSSAYLEKSFNVVSGWNELQIEGMDLHVLHLRYSNKDSFLKRIFKFIQFSVLASLRVLQIKSDVVLATSTPLTIAIPGIVYSKLKKVPMVFEVRDLWPELPIAVGALKNPLLIKLASWLEKYTYKNSKRLIGLSPGMCDGIIRHGVPSEHVTLATNSCDTALFDVSPEIGKDYLNKCLSFVNGRKLVVYTGTFGLINSVGYLVKLAKAMQKIDSNICFVAIGDGMEKNAVIQSAKELQVLGRNLYIQNPVAKTEIVKLLSAADLSLSLFGQVPAMWNNSANKLFDALASCTPIAINYKGWQQEFIEMYNCGLVLDPMDFASAARDLASFLNDSHSYSHAKQSCSVLAHEKFSRDEMANRIETTLLEAIND